MKRISMDVSALILEIGALLNTQNNRLTKDPIFAVQELQRTWGMDSAYSDTYAWIDDDGDDGDRVADEDKARELDELEDEGTSTGTWRQVFYKDEYVSVMWFFTDQSAKDYVANRQYRHDGKLRTYAESAYGNHEIIAVRRLLKEIAK